MMVRAYGMQLLHADNELARVIRVHNTAVVTIFMKRSCCHRRSIYDHNQVWRFVTVYAYV